MRIRISAHLPARPGGSLATEIGRAGLDHGCMSDFESSSLLAHETGRLHAERVTRPPARFFGRKPAPANHSASDVKPWPHSGLLNTAAYTCARTRLQKSSYMLGAQLVLRNRRFVASPNHVPCPKPDAYARHRVIRRALPCQAAACLASLGAYDITTACFNCSTHLLCSTAASIVTATTTLLLFHRNVRHYSTPWCSRCADPRSRGATRQAHSPAACGATRWHRPAHHRAVQGPGALQCETVLGILRSVPGGRRPLMEVPQA